MVRPSAVLRETGSWPCASVSAWVGIERSDCASGAGWVGSRRAGPCLLPIPGAVCRRFSRSRSALARVTASVRWGTAARHSSAVVLGSVAAVVRASASAGSPHTTTASTAPPSASPGHSTDPVRVHTAHLRGHDSTGHIAKLVDSDRIEIPDADGGHRLRVSLRALWPAQDPHSHPYRRRFAGSGRPPGPDSPHQAASAGTIRRRPRHCTPRHPHSLPAAVAVPGLISALTNLIGACAQAAGEVYGPIAAAPPDQEGVEMETLSCHAGRDVRPAAARPDPARWPDAVAREDAASRCA